MAPFCDLNMSEKYISLQYNIRWNGKGLTRSKYSRRGQIYLEAKVNGPSRETCHSTDHMRRDDAGFLKIGENIEAKARQCTAPCRHNNDPFANEIVAPFQLPLGDLSMPDVHATGNWNTRALSLTWIQWIPPGTFYGKASRNLRSSAAILRNWANMHDSGDRVPVSDMYGNPGTTWSHCTDIVYLKSD